MVAAQLTSATQFEIAKLRIIKILRDNNLSQYITPFSTYGAVAAINSSINSSQSSAYQLLNNTLPDLSASPSLPTPLAIPSAKLYSASDSLTKPTFPINKLISLYNTDPGFFNIVTSKAFMLAYTNANSNGHNTVIAWDDYTNNVVYANRETATNNAINSNWNTTYGQTIKLESLKYFTNYVAALQVYGEFLSGVSTNTYAFNYSATLPQYSSYVAFKCIVGEPKSTDVCTISKWPSSNTRVFLLNVNVLSNNEISGTNAIGSIDATNIGYIAGMMTQGTGFWNTFDANFPTLIDAVGGRDKFLPIYYRLNYDMAVTPVLYGSIHDSISNISQYPYIKDILNNPFALNLIIKGIMTISQANSDYSITEGARLLEEQAFQKWALQLPDVSFINTQNIYYQIQDFPNLINEYPMPTLYTPWDIFVSNNQNTFPSTVTYDNQTTTPSNIINGTTGYAMATNNVLANLLRNDVITNTQLFSINDRTPGFGIYGDGISGGDTYINLKNKFSTNPYALEMLKLGIPITAFCIETAEKACGAYNYGLINSYSSPASADEFGANQLDCMFNLEMATLFNSDTANLWFDPYDLGVDIYTYLCS
jgi:hypothetical protein